MFRKRAGAAQVGVGDVHEVIVSETETGRAAASFDLGCVWSALL